MFRQIGEAFPSGVRHDFGYMRQQRRLVPPFLGPWSERSRREKGRVRFDEQAARGDVLDDLQKMLTTAFVTDPAGHANKEAPLKVRVEFMSFSGETVHHALDRAGCVEDRAETLVCPPFMEKHRHFEGLSQPNLRLEGRLLDVPG